jgi:hypothetical protein
MHQPFLRIGQPLTTKEKQAFESLQLTAGHWAALAPVPLIQTRLRLIDERDRLTLHALRIMLGDPNGLGNEAEVFWLRLAEQVAQVPEGSPPADWVLAMKLLGWHLATYCSRAMREAYIEAIHRATTQLMPGSHNFDLPLQVVVEIRTLVERYLGVKTFDPDMQSIEFEPSISSELVQRLARMPCFEREQYLLQLAETQPNEGPQRLGLIDQLRGDVETFIANARAALQSRLSASIARPIQVRLLPNTSLTSVDLTSQTTSGQPSGVHVEIAEPFSMVSWTEGLAAARAVSVAAIREWLLAPLPSRNLLFDDCRMDCPAVAVVRDPTSVPPMLWIVGDLHADLLSLVNIVAHAERIAQAEGQVPAFLFLGDFVDRGQHDHELLLYLFGMILRHPDRVCVLAGNHDLDLQWNPDRQRFQVTIEPAEYCERLNGMLDNSTAMAADQIELARLLIPFWQSRPRAVILPDGTMYSHAGFPHTDTHASLRSVADLGNPRCINDFVWARISDRPRKRPNRANRGHEFGWADFSEFCRLSSRLGIPPVQRLVRGHDHVANRWEYLADYAEHPVLTINAMSRRMDGELHDSDLRHPYPVVARHRVGMLPTIIRLPLDAAEVQLALNREGRVLGEVHFDEGPV